MVSLSFQPPVNVCAVYARGGVWVELTVFICETYPEQLPQFFIPRIENFIRSKFLDYCVYINIDISLSLSVSDFRTAI